MYVTDNMADIRDANMSLRSKVKAYLHRLCVASLWLNVLREVKTNIIT